MTGARLIVQGTPPQIALPGAILFNAGTSTLDATSDMLIQMVAGHLHADQAISTVRIEAHSDSQGSADANMAMTKRRAFAVACALRAAGVDCKRLLPVGFGETKPIGSNQSAAGRAQNRRIELYHAAIHQTPVGGMPVDGGGEVAGDPCR